MDASFFEQFGGGAGGGFLGVLLGYLMQRRALEDLKIEMATKASQHEVDALKDLTDGLVREKTCIARTDGLLKSLTCLEVGFYIDWRVFRGFFCDLAKRREC